MNKKNLTGLILIILFISVTGIIFLCDFSRSGGIGLSRESEKDTSVYTGAAPEGSHDTASESENSSEMVQDTICVYVCGHVKKPGVYSLKSGARIYEAIRAAGGVKKDAQPDQLNLAGVLKDGDKVYVPAEGDGSSGQQQAGGTGVQAGAQSTLLDINTATAEQLQTLPGIGASRAADIIAYRESNGPFSSKEDLMKIPGIKGGVYGRIETLITVQ